MPHSLRIACFQRSRTGHPQNEVGMVPESKRVQNTERFVERMQKSTQISPIAVAGVIGQQKGNMSYRVKY